jgi:hypothetical protein
MEKKYVIILLFELAKKSEEHLLFLQKSHSRFIIFFNFNIFK